jgi:NAD(P)H-hydrate epimerase
VWIANLTESRELDRRASEQFGVPAMVLMERAGIAVAEAALELLKGKRNIAILCGPGNNGGDGFVAARILLEHGISVTCLVSAEHDQLRKECGLQLAQAVAQGIDPIFPSDPQFEPAIKCLGCSDLIIDALLGTGSHGELRSPINEMVSAANRSGIPILAVDLPSGVETDSGQALGESIWATRTVTFGLPKPFLFQGVGLEHAGHWTVANIGFPPELLAQPRSARLIDPHWVAGLLPERLRDSHKGTNGRLLIVAGSLSMRGAAILATRSALRSGIGLVTVAAIPAVCDAIATSCPEATLIPLPEVDGVIAPSASDLILQNCANVSAALFGPGLTHQQPVIDFFNRLWPRWEAPSLLDADALNAVAHGVPLPPSESVLTPHPGEMGRLLRRSSESIQADRFGSVIQAVNSFAKTVVLKGPHSIVGSPGEPLNLNQNSNSGMASAGMGDVLSGIIATLLAQGIPPYEAASCGVHWHGYAGDLCALDAPIGFTASDVANKLPHARVKLTAS